MINFKNITELPVAESADGLNLIVNAGGAAKQIAASAVGAQADFAITDESSPAFIKNKPEVVQADWTETDETSAAFIKNKPIEKWDLNFTCHLVWNSEVNEYDEPILTVNTGTFDGVKNKALNGIPKVIAKIKVDHPTISDTHAVELLECTAAYIPVNLWGDNPEFIYIRMPSIVLDNTVWAVLKSDNTMVFD